MARLRSSAIWLTLILCIARSPLAFACQIPVFRYALERWAPAEYLASLSPSASGFTVEEMKAAAMLDAARHAPGSAVNLESKTEQPTPERRGPAQLALHYPRKLREPEKPAIWQAPLTVPNVQRLLDSPLRQELRRRLLAGESAIWVLVESGDAAKDDDAAKTLSEAIAEAQSSLKLPEGVVPRGAPTKNPGTKARENAETLRLDLPLKIAFSVLRVRRTDPAESVLLAMLTHLEDDLGDLATQPMAFPVFGRGRVLEPLVGAGIRKDNVLEHSGYLCGACSCEVKDQNPGIDLLITANWDPVDTTPQLEVVRITPQTDAPHPRGPNSAIAAGSILLLTIAAWLILRPAHSSRRDGSR